MNISQMDQVRHADEKGAILRTLQADYTRSMTSVRNLAGALDLQGYPMSVEGIQFALTYLSDLGFVLIWRYRDTPGWRSDREYSEDPDRIVFAKLTPRGLQLIDGKYPADAGVRF